ncbi:acylphosphatase-2 isoform X1 [Aquila chrysaetos chrysaetos]|uniref:acylphosphatase-2 isoform X1 n=1 Tax=Aquila chrysaetos chrysaetos TaxID=223781 RepID=UPI0011771B7A|nr:acylphosphatase-2 isoform X1 [Aquila chrysaetos chrysaetos]XP_029879233.1 acylphosphatase-2 isoform X1 [Aquila chrysaetos chrysaetos]
MQFAYRSVFITESYMRCLFQDGKAMSDLPVLLYRIVFPVLKIQQQYTEEEARKLGVVGWVKNTSKGTVTGQVQGPEDKVNAINHGGMGRRRCLKGIILYGSQVLSTKRCTLQTCSCWSLLLAKSH